MFCFNIFPGNVLQQSNREEHFDEFMTWLHDNGVETTCVSVEQFDEGYGLKSNKDVEVGDISKSLRK